MSLVTKIKSQRLVENTQFSSNVCSLGHFLLQCSTRCVGSYCDVGYEVDWLYCSITYDSVDGPELVSHNEKLILALMEFQ
jgi:hypothetical protein